jgi:hypothetical protein
MKFLLLWLVVVGASKKLTRIFLENQLGFGANLTSVQYSKVYQDATFEHMCVRVAPILMKFLFLWLVVGCCWSVEKVTSTFLKNQPGFGAIITPVLYLKVYQDASLELVSVIIGSILMKFLLLLPLLAPV